MTKVSITIAKSFLENKTHSLSNTSTDGKSIILFGNTIVRKIDDHKYVITLAGWNTPTTRERLNTFLNLIEYKDRFYTKKGKAYFGDKEICSKEEIIISTK